MPRENDLVKGGMKNKTSAECRRYSRPRIRHRLERKGKVKD